MKIELRKTNNSFHLGKWRYSSFNHRSYYRTNHSFLLIRKAMSKLNAMIILQNNQDIGVEENSRSIWFPRRLPHTTMNEDNQLFVIWPNPIRDSND